MISDVDLKPPTTAKAILERLFGNPLPPEKQKMLDRMTAAVKLNRKAKEAEASLVRSSELFAEINSAIKADPDVQAYMDAHSLELPKE